MRRFAPASVHGRPGPVVWVVPGLLTLVVTLAGIGHAQPWRDEVATWSAASRPLPDLARMTRTIDAATAAVGLTIAPSAMPVASSTPGMTALKKSPRRTALSTTCSSVWPPLAVKSRRKSIAGIDTAVEYSSGGRTPASRTSGVSAIGGTNGSRLMLTPTSTSRSGAATPTRGARTVTATMHTIAAMPTSR